MTKREFVIQYVLARASSAGQCHGEARMAVSDACTAWDAINEAVPVEVDGVASEVKPAERAKKGATQGKAAEE